MVEERQRTAGELITRVEEKVELAERETGLAELRSTHERPNRLRERSLA